MELSLANTSLKEIPDIEHIPLQTLNISLNSLRSLNHLPPSIRKLEANNNQLTGSSALVFLPHIEKLSLQSNHIRFIEREEFQECFPRLKELNVNMNSLETIHFLQDSRIETLLIDHNRLKILDSIPSTLKNLSVKSNILCLVQSRLPLQLQELDLSLNILRYAGLPLFWGRSLIKLDLHYNSIEQFPRNLPDTLEILLLHNNRIAELPKDLPENLKILNMNNNRIRVLPSYKKTSIQIALFNNNCIVETEGHSWARYFLFEHNWNQTKYHQAQRNIESCWKRYRICLRLRHFARINKIKQELFQVSMRPERCLQLDTLSWFS